MSRNVIVQISAEDGVEYDPDNIDGNYFVVPDPTEGRFALRGEVAPEENRLNWFNLKYRSKLEKSKYIDLQGRVDTVAEVLSQIQYKANSHNVPGGLNVFFNATLYAENEDSTEQYDLLGVYSAVRVVPQTFYHLRTGDFFDRKIDLEMKFLYDLRVIYAGDGLEKYNFDFMGGDTHDNFAQKFLYGKPQANQHFP